MGIGSIGLIGLGRGLSLGWVRATSVKQRDPCKICVVIVELELTTSRGGIKTFFNTCVALAGDDRDIDLYHWSSERFSAARKTTISVLVAKGRARVGVAASVADWPKRIRDLQFLDHEGYAAAT